MLNVYNFSSFGNILIFTNYYDGFNIHLPVIKVNFLLFTHKHTNYFLNTMVIIMKISLSVIYTFS